MKHSRSVTAAFASVLRVARRISARLTDKTKRKVRAILRRMDSAVIEGLASAAPERVAVTELRAFPMGPDVELTVYWLDRPSVLGPSASLYWKGQELLRMDLHDANPHVHYGFAQSKLWRSGGERIYLPETPIETRAEFAAYQIKHNLAWCFANHPDPRAKRSLPDQAVLQEAASWLHKRILDLHRSKQS
ncbi:hypothetical protein [Thiocapsa roseopersicina]|uniref:Uncharacterized protein n=1 Tax=Thiocapsa roseopersicina TaxID=1058 RepID=A0A1H2WDD7_THIRO|nr:hypothetical protein [Thiocapsa roseopersicina]SDW78274.1 hypothetical protein SAMN05421783_108141 [Thiocapsa roseopersicina]